MIQFYLPCEPGWASIELLDRIRRRWKLEDSRQELAHATSDSFSSLDQHLFPLLYASLLTRSVSHRFCMSFLYIGIIPLFNESTYAQARVQRIHTLTHTINTFKYLRPPPFIQSHHAFSLAQFILTFLSIYHRLSRSLLLSFFLSGILVLTCR